MPKNPPEIAGLVSTAVESPVPGLGIELANLLVQAIKTRRKFFSKSQATGDEDEEKETFQRSMLEKLQNNADDKTTAFLNELRRQVEHASSRRNNSKNNPCRHCIKFLLELLSDGSNSFHLRRSGLALAREILKRSSDARAYLVSDGCLLDFVSVVEGVENDEAGKPEQTSEANEGGLKMSPKAMFQLEAMELIHHLATKFGKYYTQFTVASRLLGDISLNFSMNNSNSAYNDTFLNGRGNHPRSQHERMRLLRRERDIALESGMKACLSLERMIDRADEYFRILVPRFGGFNTKVPHASDQIKSTNTLSGDSKLESNNDEDGANDGHDDDDDDGDDDDDDDDSIDWEEGDIDLPIENTNTDLEETSKNDSTIDHESAVSHTLEVMGWSGALLDGNLAVQMSSAKSSMGSEPKALNHNTETTIAATTTAEGNADTTNEEVRTKLQKLVKKLSTRRLPRLNQWIHALSHADGMEERAIIDPVTGSEGPVSLVLLSAGKRAMRGKLLQKMMKVRGEIEVVLQSSAKLGVNPNTEAENEKNDNDNGVGASSIVINDGDTPSNRAGHNVVAGMKRSWLPAHDGIATTSKKKKTSRFKVIYRK